MSASRERWINSTWMDTKTGWNSSLLIYFVSNASFFKKMASAVCLSKTLRRRLGLKISSCFSSFYSRKFGLFTREKFLLTPDGILPRNERKWRTLVVEIWSSDSSFHPSLRLCLKCPLTTSNARWSSSVRHAFATRSCSRSCNLVWRAETKGWHL